MRHIAKRHDHSFALLLRRTISAQIHFFGLLVAIAGLALLMYFTYRNADPLQFWACATFGLTAILVFLTSSIYHFLNDGFAISPKLEQLFEDLDHFSIYLFIAGTYTPILLNTLQPPMRHMMIVGVWTVAILGIAYTHFKKRLPKWAQNRFFSTGIFLMMGWIALLRINAILSHLSTFAITNLILGALSYTIGAVIYATKRPVLMVDIFGFHELWHIMVLGGFFFHYLVVLNFYYGF